MASQMNQTIWLWHNKSKISRGINAGYGHSGRDLGYTANLFYFPSKMCLMLFL